MNTKEPETPDEIYNSFWKGLVEVEGKLDLPLVKQELANYYTVLQTVPEVYKHITDNEIASPFEQAGKVAAESDYQYAEKFDQAQQDMIEKFLSEKMSLPEVLIELLELRNNQNPDDIITERVEDDL